MRDESCPICGEQDAYDGDECRVCGFIQPPSQFQDPDVDMAKQLDLRKDQDGSSGDQINDMENATQDVNRDGFNDETGEPMGDQEEGLDDAQPMLACSNCGTEFEAGHPASTNTADPQDGDATGADGPADGDVCPACGKGLLVTPDEQQAAGAAEQENLDAESADEDADQGPGDDDVVSHGADDPNPFAKPSDDDPDDQDDDGTDDDDQKSPFSKKTPPARRKPPPGKK